MAIYIYTVDGFPGTRESGRIAEYCQVLGQQINLEGGTWTKLLPRYERRYFTDYVNRGEAPTNIALKRAARELHTDEEIAQALIAKYQGIGVVRMDEDPESHPSAAKRVVEQAEKQNKAWKAYVVSAFQEERKMRQLTGRGRLEPSQLERWCFAELGMPEPGTLDEIKAERAPANVQVQLPPEIADLVAEALAARKVAAAKEPELVKK